MMKNVTDARIEGRRVTRTFNIVAINETLFLANNIRTYYWYGPDEPDPRPDPLHEKRDVNFPAKREPGRPVT